ncbi:hypothetical protein [Rhizobacter sp. Root1221]|uniref:hypothetical protein n=1 Tax=Rhizobacter sp. Root1221 TaxID=1736433 RepID=UPI0012FB1263|nr:hypothetical protein [Rhizobacter sp. Root1221]
MPLSASVTVLQGDTAVDIEVRRRAVEVQLGSAHEERAYEALDSALRERTRQVFESEGSGVHVLDDWWPNRTAVVEADEQVVNSATVDALQRLLTNEYAEWSVGIEVYRGLGGERPENLGPVHIYVDAILTTKQLLHLVASDV